MKRNLILLTILTFLPIYAFGDFVPGRVRASAHAELTRSQGDGRYEETQGASVIEYKTDGKGFTQFHLSLDKRPMIPFTILRVEASRCGRTFHASYNDDGHPSDLTIDEIRPMACRNPGATIWHVTLTTAEDGGAVSRLVLQGEPEFFRLTQ